MSTTIVAMFSGGEDSTYMLHKLLTETQDRIHVHYISLRGAFKPGWKVKDKAVESIISHCKKNYRRFDYTTSVYEFNDHRSMGREIDLVILAGTRVAMDMPGETIKIAISRNADEQMRYESEVAARGVSKHSGSDFLKACIEGMEEPDRSRLDSKLYYPLLEMRKYEILENLPPKLLEQAFSCEKSPDGKPCNSCLIDVHAMAA